MPRVLLLTRSFPPTPTAGSKRPFQFAKNLPRYGWEPIVVTSPFPREQAPQCSAPSISSIRVEYFLGSRSWSRRQYAYATDCKPMDDLNERANRGSPFPIGPEAVMVPYTSYRAARLCRREGISVIYATGGPPAVLLVGWLTARLARLPLCIELRDPWSLGFLQKRKPFWVRRAEARIERMLFDAATHIVFTSSTTRDAYRAYFPEIPPASMSTIYTGCLFDEQQVQVAPRGPITLVHYGNCFGNRSLRTVLQGLSRVRDQHHWPSEGIRLLNIGRVRATDLELAQRLGLQDVLQYRPPVAYGEGRTLLQSADVLLLLGYGQESGYIPAKTFDYLSALTPILCLTACPELAGIIVETKAGWVVSPEDVDGIVRTVNEAITIRRGNSVGRAHDVARIERFDARHSTAALASMLTEATRLARAYGGEER